MSDHVRRSDAGERSSESRLEVLTAERNQLTNLAYRMLGSLVDAEDAVQEAYARWLSLPAAQRHEVRSPGAWLQTVVTRVCLDTLGSARVRRERYVGEWLPEPVPDPSEWSRSRHDGTLDPAERITLDESVDMAFLVVLDSMTAAERVTFLLHDVFGYPFSEVAEIVGRSEVACRQLAVSARRRTRDRRPLKAPTAQRAEVVRTFKRAWEAKDIQALIAVLDPAATVVADGGGRVAAALEPIVGSEAIAGYLVYLAGLAADVCLVERTVNGQPGLVATHGGDTVAVYAFDIVDDHVQRLWVMRNPEKLRSWAALR